MATKVFRWTRQFKRSDLRHAIEAYQRVGITHFQLLGSHDGRDCRACRALVGRTFAVDAPPDLPPADCTCQPYGSRLCAVAAGKFG